MSAGAAERNSAEANWPALRVDDWTATRETLHMWPQIVGKFRLAGAPMVNHWWQTTLYVTPRSLTTGSIPNGPRTYSIDFDFYDHRLQIDAEHLRGRRGQRRVGSRGPGLRAGGGRPAGLSEPCIRG
jgi:hypothetical protein